MYEDFEDSVRPAIVCVCVHVEDSEESTYPRASVRPSVDLFG